MMVDYRFSAVGLNQQAVQGRLNYDFRTKCNIMNLQNAKLKVRRIGLGERKKSAGKRGRVADPKPRNTAYRRWKNR